MDGLEAFVQWVLRGEEAVLELPLSLDLAEVKEALHAHGWFVALVDRAPVFDKTTLLHALYQSCAMPVYFGFNWDALADVLRDFSWLEAKGYVLMFQRFDTLKERAPEVAGTFLDIVREVAEARRAAGWGPLRVLLTPRARELETQAEAPRRLH